MSSGGRRGSIPDGCVGSCFSLDNCLVVGASVTVRKHRCNKSTWWRTFAFGSYTTSLGSSRPPTRSRGPEEPGARFAVILWRNTIWVGVGVRGCTATRRFFLTCLRVDNWCEIFSGVQMKVKESLSGATCQTFQPNASRSPALLESREARPAHGLGNRNQSDETEEGDGNGPVNNGSRAPGHH